MYKIVKKRWVWFSFSIALGVLSILAIIFFGLRIGIDYNGGTVLQFKSENTSRVELTNKVLTDLGYSGFQIKPSGRDEVIVRLKSLDDSQAQHLEIKNKLSKEMPDYSETAYDNVGPTIGKDLTVKSIWAVVIASFGIIFFIAFAFRKIPKPLSSWKFGVCAVIALIHDLLITIGFVAIVGHFFIWMEVDALFVTALLTIMGFSVHDTIVVYDRLRENFIRNPHEDLELAAEASINQTLVRSINTSMTTIIVLLALLVFGSMSIRHFVLTLVFGIFIGTYSSIFNAVPLLVAWQKKSLKSA